VKGKEERKKRESGLEGCGLDPHRFLGRIDANGWHKVHKFDIPVSACQFLANVTTLHSVYAIAIPSVCMSSVVRL